MRVSSTKTQSFIDVVCAVDGVAGFWALVPGDFGKQTVWWIFADKRLTHQRLDIG